MKTASVLSWIVIINVCVISSNKTIYLRFRQVLKIIWSVCNNTSDFLFIMVSCEATLESELIMLITVHALRDDSGSFAEVIMKIIIFFQPRGLYEPSTRG